MSIVGEPFKDYLKKQISNRQIVHGKGVNQNRTPKELMYLNSRTSWVKLASSTFIDQSRLDFISELKGSGLTGTQLAQQYVLFNGTTQILTKETSGGTSIIPGVGNPTIKAQRADAPLGTMIDIDNPNYVPPQTVATPGSFSGKQGSPKAGILGNSSNPAYGMTGNTDFGLVPMPGIESATIKTLDKGSIKRASLVIKAHNRLQFDIIDMLYLRLGFTIMLEWGDSHYIKNKGSSYEIQKMGNTLIENFWFRQLANTNNTFEILQKIEDEREKYSASYDALFGRVVNFSWTFNPDASYTINLDILSMGDVIESLKTNIPVHSFYTQNGERDREDLDLIDANKYKSTVGYIFNQIKKVYDPTFSDIFNQPREKEEFPVFDLDSGIKPGVPSSNSYRGQRITVQSIDNSTSFPSEIIGETIPYELISDNRLFPTYDLQNTNNEPGTIRWNKAFDQGSQVTQAQFNQAATVPPVDYIRMAFMPPEFSYYVRLGAFLAVLEETVLTYHNNDINQPSIKFNNKVEDNLMYFMPNMVSIDPKVCLISNNQFKQTQEDGNFYVNTSNIASEIEPFIYRNGDNSYGRIMNIYLNFGFILEQLNKVDKDDNVYLQDFMKNICNSINSSLGGVNNLFPKMNPKTNTYFIYDETSLPGKDKLPTDIFPKSSLPKEIGRFNLYGYSIGGKGKTPKNSSNFVHKVGITTSVTPEYATIISIGATANGEVVGENATAFSKWNIGIKDRFNTTIDTGKKSSLIFDPVVTSDNFLDLSKSIITQKEQKYRAIRRNYFDATAARNGDSLIYLGLTKFEITNERSGAATNPYTPGYAFNVAQALDTDKPVSRNFKINSDVISSNKQIYSAYYKNLQNRAAVNTSKSSGDIGFLPFKLQLDMDGISGLRIYNKIDIDPGFLPSNYSRRKESDPNILEFIVTDVTHTIRNNQWITSIDSIASVANIISTKELEEASLDFASALPSLIPTIGQGGLVGANVNQLAKSISTNGPNANRLRATLAQLGYTEKGKELDNGGDITASTEKMASAVFRKIKELHPSIGVKATGGNDYYHTTLNYTSRHVRGRGVDFIIFPATDENINKVEDVLKAFTKGEDPNMRYINEYADPTRAATGKHFHMSWGVGTEATSQLKASRNSPTVFKIEDVTNTNIKEGERRESMYRDKQRIIRDINKEILELGGTRQFNPNVAEDGSGGGYSYNDINPELQDAREYLNNLKRNPNAQYGPTSTQNLLDQSPTGNIILGEIPSTPLNLDSDGFIIGNP